MICRRDPRFILTALGVGFALVLTGCTEQAAAPLRTGTDTPNNPAFTRLLRDAEAAIAQGKLAAAGRKLDAARAVAPDDPDLWIAIARLRFRGGEHLTALEAADRALALGPDYAPALLLRALMVRDAHGFAAAIPWFEAALAADPESADAWAEYAAALGDGGRYGAMLDAVRSLVAIAPVDPRATYLQAVLAARGGEYALARSLLTRSGISNRKVASAMLLDALLNLQEDNPDSAAATLEILVLRQPANPALRELLARALLLSGREAELVQRFAIEAQHPESSAYLLMLIARAHERLGDRALAAPLLARAYGTRAHVPVVLAGRAGLPEPTVAARQAVAAENANAARTLAEEFSTRFPTSADVAILAGDIALVSRNPAGALEAYALATRVRRPWPLTAKAVHAYRLIGDDAAATTLLARHVAGEPDGFDGLIVLARRQAERGNWQSVALLLDHVIRRGGGHDAAVLGLRIDAARALGKSEAAARFTAQLAQLRPRPLTGA